jgi:hypothetical protein
MAWAFCALDPKTRPIPGTIVRCRAGEFHGL